MIRLIEIRKDLWVNPQHIVAINAATSKTTDEELQGMFRLVLTSGSVLLTQAEVTYLLAIK